MLSLSVLLMLLLSYRKRMRGVSEATELRVEGGRVSRS